MLKFLFNNLEHFKRKSEFEQGSNGCGLSDYQNIIIWLVIPGRLTMIQIIKLLPKTDYQLVENNEK